MSNLSNAFNEIELNESDYINIDQQVSDESVIEFIEACEKIQMQIPNIDTEMMYRYLVTIMLNQA
jgi:two-component SAPR family response regulator